LAPKSCVSPVRHEPDAAGVVAAADNRRKKTGRLFGVGYIGNHLRQHVEEEAAVSLSANFRISSGTRAFFFGSRSKSGQANPWSNLFQ